MAPEWLKRRSSIPVAVIFVATLVISFTNANSETVAKGSIVTNGVGCADIGRDIFEKGGNAADAAIASLFCEGVSMPQSCGLGGGFLLTIYNKTTGQILSLDARETAPAAAHKDMFNADKNLKRRGGLAVGVPSELIGYWHLYNRFGGGVPWRDLVQPTIDLCKKGIYVTEFLAARYKSRKDLLYADPVLRETFIDPTTNDTYKEGQYAKRPRLVKTLKIIAEEGGLALNGGSLTEGFVQDVRDKGGILTVEDMKNYKPRWQTPHHATLIGNHHLYTAPLPGAGIILTFILNILSSFIDVNEPTSVTTYQRMVEAFKFGYGKRGSFGDMDFNHIEGLVANLTSKEYAEAIRHKIFDNKTSQDPFYYDATRTFNEDHGTAHISVLAPNGDAVSVTSTINWVFGAGFASNSTGIILNDEMNDFSAAVVFEGYDLPPAPSNFAFPGQRPLSSMCPTIVLNENNEVVLVIGGGGGTQITTTVAQVIMKHLWFNWDLKQSVDDKRLHHQLFPMQINFEQYFNTKENRYIIDGLEKIGHKYIVSEIDGFSAATAISRSRSGNVTAASDRRRFSGSIAYVY